MEYFTYIIYSPATNKYYVGETESLPERLNQHNSHLYSGSFTSRAHDWTFVWVVSTSTRQDARKIEQYIKSMKSKKYITQLVNDEDFKRNFATFVFKKLEITITQVI